VQIYFMVMVISSRKASSYRMVREILYRLTYSRHRLRIPKWRKIGGRYLKFDWRLAEHA